MKPNSNTSPHFQFLARTLLAAAALFALSLAHTFADVANSSDTLKKLDAQIVLALKQSRGQPPFDQPTSLQPDIPAKIAGRVLVDVKASVSRGLLDQVALVGGQVVKGSETATTFQAWVPLSQLETLALRSDVKFISPARPTGTSRVKP